MFGANIEVKIETAGQIKKRERQKVKSEKTLGAKLKLKAKNNKMIFWLRIFNKFV